MIYLTRLNHAPVVLNADLIETVEVTPDTVISLTTGEKLVVLEPVEEVVRRVIDFRRAILGAAADGQPYPGCSGDTNFHGQEHKGAGRR